MIDIRGAIDATENYTLKLTKHQARACRNLKQRDPVHCFGANIIRYSDPNVQDVLVELTRTFIQFKNADRPVKYVNSADMQRIARINDLKGRRGMIELLRVLEAFEAKEVKLLKPDFKRSYAWTRSDAFAEVSRISKERNKGKKHRRRYTKPQAKGLRSGTGKAHSWEVPE